MKTIVCYGDSNTYGYNAENDGRFSPEYRWPIVMASKLGKEYCIVPEGLPGRTTVFNDPLQAGLNGLECLSPILRSHGPFDLLIFMLGTNDTKERFGSNAALITKGMEELIKQAMLLPVWVDKPTVLLVSPVSIAPEYIDVACGPIMGKHCAEKSRELASYYAQLADDMNIHFFDAGTVANVHSLDYMHLTAEGQVKLGQALAKEVEKILN